MKMPLFYKFCIFGGYIGVLALIPYFAWIEIGLMLLIICIADRYFRKLGGA